MPAASDSATGSSSFSSHGAARQRFQDLDAKRQAIELEIKALDDVLASHKIGMTEPLVDADGFPRADVDVYTVRHTRHSIIRLRNDLADVMRELERAMHAVFESVPPPSPPASQQQQQQQQGGGATASAPPRQPLAVVNRVEPGSPAAAAGLAAGDRVVAFGDVTGADGLKRLAPLVARMENEPLAVAVVRGDAELELTLTPRKWAGRGLLGCHLLPPST
ncbi:hypothetical protein DFJ73DRAFT_954932 [Zopfochytrium polystomum]|nr:hypothetical protein DFJ73DRAFT_954932 [Zopfochytrium polystomum]